MQVWIVPQEARWKYRAQKWRKNHHLRTITTLLGYIFASKAYIDNRKNLLNSNSSFTCPHNIANFSPLAAEIGSGVCGTPANFNGFRVFASLLQRRRSPEANQSLHDVWPSPGLVHCINIFGASCPLTEFCHSSSGRQSNFAAWYKEWN